MTTARYLDTQAVAERLDVGVRTVREYLHRSRVLRAAGAPGRGTYGFPEPDQVFGRSPAWKVSTIDRWQRECPGQGAGGGRPRKATD